MDGNFSVKPEEARIKDNVDNTCTSPRRFEDTTFDNTTTDDSVLRTFGILTPKAPFRGLSIKEVEERLSTLQKENFSLKLRLYLLEERAGTTITLDKEVIIKENVDLKMEVENQRRDLQEKHKLLCEALKAMEIQEDECKKSLEDKERELRDLRRHSDLLENKSRETVTSNVNVAEETDIFDDSYRQYQKDIDELESKLIKEQEYSGHLQQLIQEYERKSTYYEEQQQQQRNECNNSGNQRDDDKLILLTNELEEKTNVLTQYNKRIEEFQRELIEKDRELSRRLQDINNKDVLINEKVNEIINLKQLLTDTNDLNEIERGKIEKYKMSIQQRNNKIMELEGIVEKQKTKILNLEGLLETAQNEVKRKNDVLLNKSPNRSNAQQKSDVGSFLVPSTSNVAKVSPKTVSTKTVLRNSSSPSKIDILQSPSSSSITNSTTMSSLSSPRKNSSPKRTSTIIIDTSEKELQQQVAKLQLSEKKAMKIIKELMNKRKVYEEEIETLCVKVKQRDDELRRLRDLVKNYDEPIKDNQTKLMFGNRSPHNNQIGNNNKPNDNECATNENVSRVDDPVELIEQYSELTTELEKQKELLLETLKEKDKLIETLQIQHEELLTEFKLRENRIIDLEFELLSASGDNNLSNKENYVPRERSAIFWIEELADKDKEIERLENELRKRTCDLQGIVNNELWEKNREIEKIQKKYANIIETKDVEINNLERDINGKDMQLTILKDKISELGVHVNLPPNLMSNAQQLRATHNNPAENLESLQEDVKLYKEEQKYYVQHIEELKSQLKNTPERENHKVIKDLKFELEHTKEELETCERLRKETSDVCMQLNGRLEELACFLDSLLKQKSVLGFLGTKTTRLRQIVDQSLDLSRSLSLSITLNPDESLVHLSNISRLLNSSKDMSISEYLTQDERRKSILSLNPEQLTLTYQSHLNIVDKKKENEQAEIIKVLREQVDNLKKEIVIRDFELNKINERSNVTVDRLSLIEASQNSDKSTQITDDSNLLKTLLDLNESVSTEILPPHKIVEKLIKEQKMIEERPKMLAEKISSPNASKLLESESESWSEPDRNVSIARIGLMEESLKPQTSSSLISRRRSPISSEYDEEFRRKSGRKSSYAENRQTIIALHEQVRELEYLVKSKDEQIFEANASNKQLNQLFDDQKSKYEELHQQYDDLQKMFEDTLETLKISEEKYQSLEEQKGELEHLVEDLQKTKNSLEERMTVKDKEMQNKINQMEAEKEKLLETATLAEKMAQETKGDIIKADEKLQSIREEMKSIEHEIRQEAEEKLQTASKQFEEQLAEIEGNAEKKVKEIVQMAEKLRLKYEEECTLRIEELNKQDEIRKGQYAEEYSKLLEDASEKMQVLEASEENLRERLQENTIQYHSKLEVLRAELDAANLHYSEAVLEKTRLINEKGELEIQLQEMFNKENNLLIQIEQFQIDFRTMKDDYQRQINAIQNEKSILELRISELESSNAELHNKFIRLQAANQLSTSPPQNFSLRTIGERSLSMSPIKHMLSVNRSLSHTSCLSNEADEDKIRLDDMGNNRSNNELEAERQQATSSPDLGIDSDHGRFSSLEANVQQRPFLRSLEVTASMNNLLEGQSCSNELCCAKTKEIITENSELRRRLLRTRRALEETVTQLTIANQRKKQVEKAICKQIHKTSQVLRIAKANLNSGSESDLTKP